MKPLSYSEREMELIRRASYVSGRIDAELERPAVNWLDIAFFLMSFSLGVILGAIL